MSAVQMRIGSTRDQHGSGKTFGLRAPSAGRPRGAERMAAAAAKVLFVSAVLGVLIASACAPSAALDRSEEAPPGAGMPGQPATMTPPMTMTLSPTTIDVHASDVAADAGASDDAVATTSDDASISGTEADAVAKPDAQIPDTATPAADTTSTTTTPQPPRVDAATMPKPDAAAEPKRVAMLMLDPQAPALGELRLRQRLEARGFVVQFMPDTALAADVAGAALVLISGSARGFAVLDHMRDVPIALITMKAWVLDDLGMTGPVRDSDYNEVNGVAIDVFAAAHPLAAGLRGPITVAEAPQTMTWGRPAAGALRIASLAGDATKLTIFAYDTGTMMVTRPAPARRLGFFATERLAAQWTTDASRLFDAAVDWTTR
jgi:hypothetical protein